MSKGNRKILSRINTNDYFDHSKNDLHWSEFLQDIQLAISFPGVALLEKFVDRPGTNLLARLALLLGEVSYEDVSAPEPGPIGFIHRIEAKEEPLQDGFGYEILSTTHRRFPCHTDDYFVERPCDVFLLHCVLQAEHGGDTIIVHLRDILEQLEPRTIAELATPSFPAHFGWAPILVIEKYFLWIRYNRLQIDRACQVNQVTLTDNQLNALDELDAVIDTSQHYFKLKPSECLVLNNKTTLHGRTAFSGTTNRLLRRVKARMRPSEKTQKAKFAEYLFHELR